MAFIRCSLTQVGNTNSLERWLDSSLAVADLEIKIDNLDGTWTVTQVHPEQISTAEEYRFYAATLPSLEITREAHPVIDDLTGTTPWGDPITISSGKLLISNTQAFLDNMKNPGTMDNTKAIFTYRAVLYLLYREFKRE